jgi:hypothetical protein
MNMQPTDHPIPGPIPGSAATQRPEHSEAAPIEDDGVDATEYVRQLIAREETGAKKAPRPSPAKPAASVQPSPPALAASRGNASSVTDDRTWLDELLSPTGDALPDNSQPTRAKPEESIDLKELREAANMMTSCVLDEFDCRGLVERAYTQLGLAVFGMLVSLVLLTMSHRVWSLEFGATVVTLLLAAASTYRCAAITRLLVRKSRARR